MPPASRRRSVSMRFFPPARGLLLCSPGAALQQLEWRPARASPRFGRQERARQSRAASSALPVADRQGGRRFSERLTLSVAAYTQHRKDHYRHPSTRPPHPSQKRHANTQSNKQLSCLSTDGH
ncbi:hypothetical protein SKAU_G00372440 [Synaphobranchus kaupii]|uniref:Uncharacterized protein n=1 Tax=Synaphobranchus kaupii TaxID=118154 RepID=A0A9Q1IDZ4_SYNKA|nr:hypothetical protein SKAU_G00372440 [Synaphobranchus kaupii]